MSKELGKFSDTTLDDGQRKRAKQEAIYKSSLIAKSGLPFFCTILEECQGDAGALLEALRFMNVPVQKSGGVIKDISNVGKLLITANDDELHLVFYVKGGDDALTPQSWCHDAIQKYGGTGKKHDQYTYVGTITNNPDKEIYVFKLKDAIISEQYSMLKERGLLPKEEEDDDEVLLGDDVFD